MQEQIYAKQKMGGEINLNWNTYLNIIQGLTFYNLTSVMQMYSHKLTPTLQHIYILNSHNITS